MFKMPEAPDRRLSEILRDESATHGRIVSRQVEDLENKVVATNVEIDRLSRILGEKDNETEGLKSDRRSSTSNERDLLLQVLDAIRQLASRPRSERRHTPKRDQPIRNSHAGGSNFAAPIPRRERMSDSPDPLSVQSLPDVKRRRLDSVESEAVSQQLYPSSQQENPTADQERSEHQRKI